VVTPKASRKRIRAASLAARYKNEKEKEEGLVVEGGGVPGDDDDEMDDEEGNVTLGVENVLNEERTASPSSPDPAARPASRSSSAGGAPEEIKMRRKRIRH